MEADIYVSCLIRMGFISWLGSVSHGILCTKFVCAVNRSLMVLMLIVVAFCIV